MAALAGLFADHRQVRRLWVSAWLVGTEVVTSAYMVTYIVMARRQFGALAPQRPA